MIGLYEIRNIVNNKVYIGSSVSISNRIKEHKSLLTRNKHHSKKLQHDWNKYGKDCFVFSILQEVEELILRAAEQKALDISFENCNMCYNTAKDATSPSKGVRSSTETKQKQSTALKRMFSNPKLKAKFLKAVGSEETRKNMSDGAKKRWANLDNKKAQAERTKSFFSNPENRAKNSQRTTAFFANPENRKASALRNPTKLSVADIEFIKDEGKKYGMQTKLCRKFNLSAAHISNIVNNKSLILHTASL